MKLKSIRQHDLKDCGVCALAMIIEYYGGHVSLEKLRLDTQTDHNGTNALAIIKASQKYGFEAMGVKVDSLHHELVKLPAIAHLVLPQGLEHFVVIYKVTNQFVYIMDPAKGKTIMKQSEFMALWDNVLLLFYPNHSIIFTPKENSLINILANLFFKEKKLFLSILICSIFFTIFTIGSSYYFQVSLEAINNGKDLSYLKIVIIIFASLLLFKLLFNSIRKSLENYLNKNIDVHLLRDFLFTIFHLPLEVVSSRSSGEIITRLNEILNIKNFFTDIIIACFLDSLLMIASIPILYRVSSKLFMILVFLIIIYLIVGLIASKIIYKMAYRNIELEADFNSCLSQIITMDMSLKNLQATNLALMKLESKLSQFLKDNFNLMRIFNGEVNLKLGISEIGLFIINTVGFILVWQNNLALPLLLTFNTLVIYFLEPVKTIIDALPKYNFLKASFQKINEFLSISLEKEGDVIELINNDINFQKVTYSYNEMNNVLNNFSAKIKEGEILLLKGASGTGKSTICKILLKYINDYQGLISLGGVNLKDLSIATIRHMITYVGQNESLFTGTIKENIIMDRNIKEEDFYNICNICLIEDIVLKKPSRYESIITNDTTFISGGEKQRIILARALLKEAKIIILDEALSEVDYEMERKIIKNLKSYLKNKTFIYITHKNQDDLFKRILQLEAP